MILECRQCGAPLDVKPDATLTKCRYCGTTSERRLLRTVSAETPRDFRPPPQWIPPPHVPAPSNLPLTYHPAPPRGAVIGALAAGIMAAVLGVTVALVTLGKPRSSGKGGVVATVLPGKTPQELAAVRIDQTRENLAKALSGNPLGSMLAVSVSHPRYQSISFMYDDKEPAFPHSFTLVQRSGATVEPKGIEALGSRLHGGLVDGSWNWAGLVAVNTDAKTGLVSATVLGGRVGGTSAQAKAQLVAMWKLVLHAVFGAGSGPTAEEARWIGAPHPFAALETIDLTTTVDKAAATLTQKFPGAALSTFIELGVTVAVDHPLLWNAELSYPNEKGGTLRIVALRGTKAFPARREALVGCLEGKLGKAKVQDRDFLAKKRDYEFTVGKLWINIGETDARVHWFPGRLNAPDWKRVMNALGACR
ncbi:hypothetical protein [Polyangium jinanense]|uniref:Uncharacterized protein n=1 Tax=Polyangium jinanense TaxID=2829994 RepID=A0A9X3XFM9_9BACT|nr:hypothetical protein [Polyangium jinanense]MDC3962268.1 hypothetical protein [Polyangium jinanense]MDC3962559.1 hypothetical protein [Polyangium jinanense]MDC3989417.1 hypothetical protein [Polyangium jinanense]